MYMVEIFLLLIIRYHLNVVSLALSHEFVCWIPRRFASEAQLLPSQFPPSGIIHSTSSPFKHCLVYPSLVHRRYLVSTPLV